MLKILSVVGTRPNFMKVAPLYRSFSQHPEVNPCLVHTGQHYDAQMSDIFFNQLGLPRPDYYLGIHGGSHTYQKANVMLAFEEVLIKEKPDVVLVVGDVNSTAACSLTAVKMHIPTVHVEAGLRSGDRRMPEEVNRIVTDAICDHLFVTEHSGLVNLAREGVPSDKTHFVGNVMIDSVEYFREKAAASSILHELSVTTKSYVLMTMHRPQNVDNKQGLQDILQIISDTTRHHPVVFAVHPRTANRLKEFELWETLKAIPEVSLVGPQGYLEFLKLMDNAALIITDSGGIQEETTYLQVPCVTFRSSTERPITVELGTNFLLADLNPNSVREQVDHIVAGRAKQGVIPPLWDGHAADRITNILVANYAK